MANTKQGTEKRQLRRKAASAAASKKRVSAKKSEQAAKSAVRTITAEERFKMIEAAAYYLAEKDGFRGDPTHYWLAAEKEIEGRLVKDGIQVQGG